MKVSVIIPALNEEGRLEEAVLRAGGGVEVIVVDGGSADSTAETALKLGAALVRSAPGRGLQMDAGATAAKGEILLFLHADTLLPDGWREAVLRAMSDRGTVAGAFTLSIRSDKMRFRLLERIVRFRSRRLGLIYGDQGIFVRRREFMRAGGFRKLPLMEDVDCVKRLRKLGKVVLLDDKVSTSSRRWDRKGLLRNTARNLSILSLYFLGVSPERLYRWYYGG